MNFVPLRRVVAVRGLDQAEVALVQQVLERQAEVPILARHLDDEAEVRLDQLVAARRGIRREHDPRGTAPAPWSAADSAGSPRSSETRSWFGPAVWVPWLLSAGVRVDRRACGNARGRRTRLSLTDRLDRRTFRERGSLKGLGTDDASPGRRASGNPTRALHSLPPTRAPRAKNPPRVSAAESRTRACQAS